MAPLSELHNQTGPARRPKVYGKRRGVQAEAREMHRQLFGTDENDILGDFEKLSINTNSSKQSKPPTPDVSDTDTALRKLEADIPPATMGAKRTVPTTGDEQTSPVEREPTLADQKSTVDSDPEVTVAFESKPLPTVLTKPGYRHKISARLKSGQKAATDSSSRTTTMTSTEAQTNSLTVAKSTQTRSTNSEPKRIASPDSARKETTQPKTRKQPARRKKKREMAPITAKETRLLQPLLSSTHVHSNVKPFPEYLREIESKCDIVKLGEGSFSNAFLVTERSTKDVSVIKVIRFQLEASHQDSVCSVDGLLREIKVLDALTNLPGFARARGRHYILRGQFPETLQEEFNNFKLNKPKQALNECPADDDDDKAFYGVIEMCYAGTELDLLTTINCYNAFDIFWMATIFLASAERDFMFEHRDLHLSNFCFSHPPTAARYNPDDAIVLGRSGLELTIIDYTLSRMQLGEDVVFDPRGVGAGSVEEPLEYDADAPQIEAIWRARRWCEQEVTRSTEDETGKSNEKWQAYMPKTTVLFLGHLLAEMRKRATKVDKSATRSEKAEQEAIWAGLSAAQQVLDCKELDNVPESAEMLLKLGVEKGLIAERDIVAFKEYLNGEAA